MNATIITALIRVLDLVSRVAEKKFDSRDELNDYIQERNQVRDQLVQQARELGSDDPAVEDTAEPAGDDPDHGYVDPEAAEEQEPEEDDFSEPNAGAYKG